MNVDVDAVILELYGLRPVEFTAARAAWTARARRQKDTAAVAAIGRLRKPTRAVWAANQLSRAHPDQAEALLRLGAELRRAHRELDGGQLRALSHEQHRLIGALAREAGQLAATAGEPLREGALREVEDLFHGVLADEAAAREWAAGRLAKAPAGAVGFDGLEPIPGAAPSPPPSPPPAAAPAPRRTAPAPSASGAATVAARQRAADTAQALLQAEARLTEAGAARDRAERDASALSEELAALRQRTRDAERAARETQRLHRQADQAHAKARQAAERAARRLEELDGGED